MLGFEVIPFVHIFTTFLQPYLLTWHWLVPVPVHWEVVTWHCGNGRSLHCTSRHNNATILILLYYMILHPTHHCMSRISWAEDGNVPMNPCVRQVYHFQLTRRVQNLDVPGDFGRGQVKVFQAIGVFKDFDISCAKNGHGSRDGWLWDEQVLKYTRNHLSFFLGCMGPYTPVLPMPLSTPISFCWTGSW